jgi:hypothetical protein
MTPSKVIPDPFTSATAEKRSGRTIVSCHRFLPRFTQRGQAGVRYMNILRSRIVDLSICETNIMKTTLILLFAVLTAQAQLAVTVSPVKVTGQKAIVRWLSQTSPVQIS